MHSENRQYGYLTPHNDDCVVRMRKGQNIAGFTIGIVYNEDVYYPMLPGNVVNGYTFDFPVRLKPVKGATCNRLFAGDPTLYDDVLAAAKELEREGVRAVSSACGFYGNYQLRLAREMNIPTALSSLMQAPWIFSLIRPGQKIGVLTANMSSVTDQLLENCGIHDRDRLVVADMYHAREFSAIVQDRGEFDNGMVKKEILSAARDIVAQCPGVGAILLECSDMPPYASYIQAELQLPVFDFTTLVRWLHSAVAQRPYAGFV